MKHAKVFGGRLQRPSAPRRKRGWMLSEAREKLVAKILYFDEVIMQFVVSWRLQRLSGQFPKLASFISKR